MSTTETVGTAVEKTKAGPREMVKQYEGSFAQVLPSHVANPDTFVRLAQGALKKGKRLPNGQTDLEVAAANNIPVFLSALLDCARLGLEPGTEQYYLTPRKVKGKTEILGIVGYQGIVELMYRAGAISSVVAECVFEKDHFEYSPGRHERPIHEIDWDSDDRGHLRLVYAYAVMKDGATSKVVVLNREAINRIKKKSQGADSEYSPWRTDEPAMWLKSAVRQLRKWVPTSSEYIREKLRIAKEVGDEPLNGHAPADADGVPTDAYRSDTDIIDAEVIEADEETPALDPDEDLGRPFDAGDPGPAGWDE